MTKLNVTQWLDQRDFDPPHIKGNAPIIQKRIKRTMGPYVIDVVSSVGNRPLYAMVNGRSRAVNWERKPGFVRVALYNRARCSEDNVDGYVGEKKWQADNWADAETEINELISALRNPPDEKSEDKEAILKQVEATLSALGISFPSG